MIDVFTREQFEKALPQKDGEPLWRGLGLVDNEYAYAIDVSPHCAIVVRSSVGRNGVSAECGEDSIRCWLMGKDGKPVGSKITRWTTRTSGWEIRLTDILRQMYKLGKFVVPCTCGNGVHAIRKVKKEGPTKGQLFLSCTSAECRYFQWLEVHKDGRITRKEIRN